ncbi:glycosyltransferase [Jeotgalibacillus aurantiacus]|uniref:glycosyltransferase n=1 Tax=Jeotgalibacillus aurantiacus TaxID=2763266 RepID=UPI001D0AA953|nr:glycosyltransferase [Jeotgalibacillus aurantiacus]
MKKKLLFTIDSLACAGAEKSLVTLLGLLDYTIVEVDLMLFSHGHELETLVPREVTILPPLAYSKYAELPLTSMIKNTRTAREVRFLSARSAYSFKLRNQKAGNIKKARLYWQTIGKVIENLPKTYDVAIAYAQGVPTFFTADKVKAAKKIAWVNVSYKLEGQDHVFQRQYYEKMDQIVAVSESSKEIFLQNYPEFEGKMRLIYDINHPEFISKMAENGVAYDDQFDGLRILTIGRLAKQKGYDIAIEACRKLKQSGLKFRWYALGKGPLEADIKNMIKVNELEEHFILLGVHANPYPYIKEADLYVQTSRFEGFGLAIAEARMLNIPVVTTEFDAVYDQMIHGENGLVVEMSGEAVANGILKLAANPELRNEIVKNLWNEKKGNIEEIEKIYELIS